MCARAILVDGTRRIVTEVRCGGFYALRDLVGDNSFGPIASLPDTDTLFADDRGMIKAGVGYFAFNGVFAPIGGRAVVLGTVWHDVGNVLRFDDAQSTIKAVTSMVRFLTREQLFSAGDHFGLMN